MAVCRPCDRGYKYCSHPCASDSRCAALARYRAHYQATPEGRRNHAEAQEKYRQKIRRVTDHCSPPAPSSAILKAPEQIRPQTESSPLTCCCRCGQLQMGALRRGFLKTPPFEQKPFWDSG